MLDTDLDGKMNLVEFTYFYRMMDFDKNGVVDKVEVVAWYKRNEYIICRPFRDDVVDDLKVKEKEELAPLFKFLDANNDIYVTAKDVPFAIKNLDTNEDGIVSHAEFKAKTDGIFTKYCEYAPSTDKEAWLERTKTAEKEDLFSVMDTNNDGELSVEEFKNIYRIMDTDKDVSVSEEEIQAFINNHLGSMCKSVRAKII